MARPNETRKTTQRRSNSLSLLKDMPKTIGSLQWARDTMQDLSESYFESIDDVDLDLRIPPEGKRTEKIKRTNMAVAALRDMVAVCAQLLPYQSPKLSAVDVRRTNNKVITVIEDMKRMMLLPEGSDIGEAPKLETPAETELIKGIDIDMEAEVELE